MNGTVLTPPAKNGLYSTTALAVIEPHGGTLSQKISQSFPARDAAELTVCGMQSPEQADGCGILVISPGWTPPRRAPERRPKCAILLLPTGVSAPADAKSAVTYGMSPKSSLTLSSIGVCECVIALQRELVTVYGDVIDRQEFKVRTECAAAEDLLAVTGVRLLLGLLRF